MKKFFNIIAYSLQLLLTFSQAADPIDLHAREDGQVYEPSKTGAFFYSEVRNHDVSGIYYIDLKAGDDSYEMDLLISAREPHLAVVSVECERNTCRTPVKYDISLSSDAELYEDII